MGRLDRGVKILVVGASGVLGRALLPHLGGNDVVGTTRTPSKIALFQGLGAEGVACDVYEPGALRRVAIATRPDIVVNLLTDLGAGPGPANSRIRVEGGPVVVVAAVELGARRLVVESVAFELAGAGAAAVAALEHGAEASGLEAVVLRFGRLWGPGTWEPESAPEPPAVHIDEAGRRAAALILASPPGTYKIA